MMTAARRQALWARGRALAGDQAPLSPRARRLAGRLTAHERKASALDFNTVNAAPDWTGWTPDEQRRLAAVAGAVLSTGRLQATIDGRLLAQVGAVTGEAALDAVLNLTPPSFAAMNHSGALTAEALTRLGSAALMADLDPRVLERLTADRLPLPDIRLAPDQARWALAEALKIVAESTMRSGAAS